MATTQNRTGGLLASGLAYLCWGFMPVYWTLLSPARSWEVIAHRIVWSLLVLLMLLLAFGRKRELASAFREIRTNGRLFLILAAAAASAGVNWWINVLAAHVDRVIELGIGMFLTPLLSVAIGCVFFRERLSGLRRIALLLAASGVAALAFNYGAVPWVAIGVSSTWAFYGALKKLVPLSPWASNTFECILMLPFALAYLSVLNLNGLSTFGPDDPGISLALAGTGIVTLIPMVAFAYAAQNLPLYLLGFSQFLNPVLTIAVGVFVLGEPFNSAFALPLAAIVLAAAVFIAAELKDRK